MSVTPTTLYTADVYEAIASKIHTIKSRFTFKTVTTSVSRAVYSEGFELVVKCEIGTKDILRYRLKSNGRLLIDIPNRFYTTAEVREIGQLGDIIERAYKTGRQHIMGADI